MSFSVIMRVMEDPLEQIVAELKDGSIRRSQRTAGARILSRTALFVGAAGTGKTKAANEIASQLGADLYRIDLSRIVSKYIGETKRNIERVFAEAEDRGAVLQLDEAGAVFGKRSEVGRSRPLCEPRRELPPAADGILHRTADTDDQSKGCD